MITSFINGRVRLRAPRFKDAEVCALAESFLREHPAVTSVRANPVTGGILIEYDPAKFDWAEARQALAAIAPEGERWLEDYERAMGWSPDGETDEGCKIESCPEAAFAIKGINPEAAEYLAMAVTFVICAGSGFLRSKNLHVYSGLTLAGMTAQHIYKYRSRIFRLLKK